MTIRRIVSIYKRALEKHTYKVQAIQAGFLLGLGDVISQSTLETSAEPYNYKRTVRFAIIGTCIGPVLQKWYTVLDRIIGLEPTYKTVIKKVAADQVIMAPAMMGAFLSSVTVMEGGDYEQVRFRLSRDYTDILINNYKLWPAAQLITFSLPANFRVLFVQIIALAWNIYLAWRINHKKFIVDK